nr:hypothetical protein B0A51_00123 [Rachicladosporium sp. CCFEE 5018]
MDFYGNFTGPLSSYQGFMDSMPGSSHPAGSHELGYERLHGSDGFSRSPRRRDRDDFDSMLNYEAPMGMQRGEMDIIDRMTTGVLPDEYEDEAFFGPELGGKPFRSSQEGVFGQGDGFSDFPGDSSRYEEEVFGPRPSDRYASLGGMMESAYDDDRVYASKGFGSSGLADDMAFSGVAERSYGDGDWDRLLGVANTVGRAPGFASLTDPAYTPSSGDDYASRTLRGYGRRETFEEGMTDMGQRGYRSGASNQVAGYPRYEGRMDGVSDSSGPFRSRWQDYEELYGGGNPYWHEWD